MKIEIPDGVPVTINGILHQSRLNPPQPKTLKINRKKRGLNQEMIEECMKSGRPMEVETRSFVAGLRNSLVNMYGNRYKLTSRKISDTKFQCSISERTEK